MLMKQLVMTPVWRVPKLTAEVFFSNEAQDGRLAPLQAGSQQTT